MFLGYVEAVTSQTQLALLREVFNWTCHTARFICLDNGLRSPQQLWWSSCYSGELMLFWYLMKNLQEHVCFYVMAPVVERIYLTPLTISRSSHITLGDLEFQIRKYLVSKDSISKASKGHTYWKKKSLKAISYKRNLSSIVLDQMQEWYNLSAQLYARRWITNKKVLATWGKAQAVIRSVRFLECCRFMIPGLCFKVQGWGTSLIQLVGCWWGQGEGEAGGWSLLCKVTRTGLRNLPH